MYAKSGARLLNRDSITDVVRPRTVSDERILAAAGAIVGRLGPAFRLSDVAQEAGISASTVMNRFGSKHGLLMAMMAAATESVRRDMRAAAVRVDDPILRIKRALVERYAALDQAGAATNNVAQLGFDLADGDLRESLAVLHRVTELELRPLLRRAVAAGALRGCPSAPVAARILTALADGTAMHWSTYPKGSLVHRLDSDVEAVLASWRRASTESEEADTR